MNRRGFLSSILKAGVGAMILPSALTYQRNWIKSTDLYLPNPEYISALYEVYFWIIGKDNMINVGPPPLERPKALVQFSKGKWKDVDMSTMWNGDN